MTASRAAQREAPTTH